MAYESLASLIEPFVDGAFDALPDGLRELVIEVFSHQSEAFDSRQWAALTPDQRRAIAKDYDLAESQQIERQAAYDESSLNGESIDWRYWAHQITTWSAAEAARLMSALDPDKFITLNERPGTDDPSLHCQKAGKIQRLAEREGMVNATPSEWLAWAVEKGIHVHAGLRVQLLPEQNTATPVVVAGASLCSETKEQRQDRRLKLCEAAGLKFNRYLSRLPDGVGRVADTEGVTRQSFSTDIKAALERRERANRVAVAIHRA